MMDKEVIDRDVMTIECTKLAVLNIQEKGISPRTALLGSIEYLYQQFIRTGGEGYLQQAVLYIRAFLELGFPFEPEKQIFQDIIDAAGLSLNALYSQLRYRGERVKLNKMQIRGMIGKWSANASNMPINEVILDIIDKVKQGQAGTYYYWTGTEKKTGGGKRIYELIITEEENLFFDMQKQLYYTIIKE